MVLTSDSYVLGADLLHQVMGDGDSIFGGSPLAYHQVEHIREGLPKLDAITSLAFIVEPVDAVDGGAFVIAAQTEKVLGILNLVGQHQTGAF